MAPRRRQPSGRFQWVQDCLTIALNEAVTQPHHSERDVLRSMGQRLIAMAGEEPADGHDALVLFERGPAPTTPRASGRTPRVSSESSASSRTPRGSGMSSARRPEHGHLESSTTAAEWLASQDVSETLARCLVEPSGATDELDSLRQLGRSDDARDALLGRLRAGAGALADSLLPGLAALAAAAPSAAVSVADVADSYERQQLVIRADPDHPRLLIVGAINVRGLLMASKGFSGLLMASEGS